MAETIRNIQQSNVETEKIAPRQPWFRHDGESVLWFNRFRRYMNLGPKRSLQAAVEQEQSQITALKSPKEPPKKEGSSRKKSSVGQIAVLPPAKPQVPGSWKAASRMWNWVERAKAYDASVIDQWAQRNIDHAFSELFSNTAGRLVALNALFETEQAMFNANCGKMTFEQFNATMARMQSILRDIRDESKLYNEDATRQGMRVFAAKEYRESFGKKDNVKKYQGN